MRNTAAKRGALLTAGAGGAVDADCARGALRTAGAVDTDGSRGTLRAAGVGCAMLQMVQEVSELQMVKEVQYLLLLQ